MDDAEVLKKELSSVQRLMDEVNVDKERELSDLKNSLNALQLENENLKLEKENLLTESNNVV